MLVLYRPNTPSLALTSYQHAGVMLVRAGNLRPLISLWYPHYDYVLAFHLFLSKHSRHISCQLPSIIYSIACSVTDKAKRFPTHIPSLNQCYTHGEKKPIITKNSRDTKLSLVTYWTLPQCSKSLLSPVEVETPRDNRNKTGGSRGGSGQRRS